MFSFMKTLIFIIRMINIYIISDIFIYILILEISVCLLCLPWCICIVVIVNVYEALLLAIPFSHKMAHESG